MAIKIGKILLTGSLVLLLCATARASFIPRGIIANVGSGGHPTCGQLIHWYNQHSDKDRRTLGYWILGFFTGIETQMINETDFATSTGVEIHDIQILELIRGFCKDNSKYDLLTAIVDSVRFGLGESLKHPHPGYAHGPNIHGQLVYGKTCQNLTLETTGSTLVEGGEYKGPVDQDHKFSLEEWMLGAATGIEAMALHNNPIQGTPIEPDALLAQFYQTCRVNPTWMIIQAVIEQEISNIQAAKKAAGQ